MAVYTKIKTRVSSYTKYDATSGRVQTAPIDYDLVLPYQRVRYISVGHPQAYWSTPASRLATSLRNESPSYPVAYDRLMMSARGKASASLGVSLVESRDALSMITKRCQSIAAAIRSLKRGQLRLALIQLGLNDTDRWVRNLTDTGQFFRKRLPDQWMEIHFGWSPLLQDISDAAKVLASEPPVTTCRGSSRGSGSTQESDIRPNYVFKEEAQGAYKLALYGKVESLNANLFVYSNLGLTNPAMIAWDLVPFSFVVDWFLPVSKWLKSYDPAFAVQLSHGGKSAVIKAMGSRVLAYKDPGQPLVSESSFSEAMEFHRSVHTPQRPSLGNRVLPLTSSLWQSVTSVAIVLQLLSSLPEDNRR